MPLIETKGAASAQGFGEFATSSEKLYIESCFSTYLYTGNGSTQTITNGIDLAGKGGMVWVKSRSAAYNGWVFDTQRGANKYIVTNLTSDQGNDPTLNWSFLSNGFSQNNNQNSVNLSGTTYASWSFRKQAKFFDVVTYTGNGSSNRQIAHNLGSTPGCVIVKRTDASGSWVTYHRGLSSADYAVFLNYTNAQTLETTYWNSTAPTSTNFTVGSSGSTNQSGGSFVAYLFAHDAGGFGLSGTDNVISCGSYTGNGSANGPEITLGYEPQWVMVKQSSASGQWWNMIDVMRGFNVSTGAQTLGANASDAEYTNAAFGSGTPIMSPTATGFQVRSAQSATNASGETYIYIAIRRGPMKVPTTGTSVFEPAIRAGTGTTATVTSNVSPIDMLFSTNRDRVASSVNSFWDRLRGGGVYLNSNATNAEASSTSVSGFDVQNGVTMQGALITNGNSYPYVNYNFRRAPGFFDIVCYTGTGVARTVDHNLGVAPELIITKMRSSTRDWGTGWASLGWTARGPALNSTETSFTTSLWWNDTAPTSTVFTVGTSPTTNGSGSTYVAYLFATLAGVSKVGSYTGTGTTKQIDCGFTAGARFVLIKRTDSTGSWYCWDSARGIVAGNDPYLLLNSTAAEVTGTDYIDTYSAGFEITSTAPAEINASGGTFVFLSIA